MDVVVRDIFVEDNPTGGVWYIPVTFIDSTDYCIKHLDSDTVTITAITMSNENNEIGQSQISDTSDWLQPSGNAAGYTLCIPSNITFLEYLTVFIEMLNNGDYTALPILLHIHKMPSSGGSGSGGGSSSSISVPTAPEIAEAVWNYGAGEEADTITDRTLSTTVDVNPSAIAQAVWNYSVAEPASGTLGTRTLTTAIPTAANIASAVLTTDVGTMAVGTDDYTVKHLIMASQKSEVVTDNGATVWKIRDERLDSETNEATIIASRTLTINSNGAIVKTE